MSLLGYIYVYCSYRSNDKHIYLKQCVWLIYTVNASELSQQEISYSSLLSIAGTKLEMAFSDQKWLKVYTLLLLLPRIYYR